MIFSPSPNVVRIGGGGGSEDGGGASHPAFGDGGGVSSLDPVPLHARLSYTIALT